MAQCDNLLYLDPVKTRKLCIDILAGAGASREDAATVAQNLVMADLRGIGSHGVSRMSVYCERLHAGLINKNPQVKVISERTATLALDGDNGLGAVVGKKAMQMCIEKAKASGVAVCSVKNGNHYGIAAFYAMMALEHDMIGMAFTNAPPTMSPWGSISPLLGTNPLAYAVPAATKRPIILDEATSVVARGKINLAEIEDRPIPEGWAMDKLGRPTTNATEALAGSVLPFGGYKGSGLSMMIDIFCAVLSGADYGCHVGQLYGNSETTQNLGFFFGAVDIKAFQDPAVFKARIDEMIDEIKDSEKAYGVEEIYVPGEIEFNNEALNSQKGIEVGPGVLRDLNRLCGQFGINQTAESCIMA